MAQRAERVREVDVHRAPRSAAADDRGVAIGRGRAVSPRAGRTCSRSFASVALKPREARALLLDDRRRRARDEALVARAWPAPWRSRPRGARSPCRGARARRRRRSRCAASAGTSPTICTGASDAGSSSTISTSDSFASGARYGAKRSSTAASPAAISGTFCAGDRPISPRSARQALTIAFSSAISASAAGVDAVEVRLRERLQRDRSRPSCRRAARPSATAPR